MRVLLKKIPAAVYVIALVACVHGFRILRHWGDVPVAHGQLIRPADPDPWLRLTVVRDWLNGGSWYNHLVANSNAPFGDISTPWTRPLDLILAALTHLQTDAALNDRLMHAAMVLPWLMMLVLMAGMAYATRQLTSARAAPVFTISLLASMPLMWNYYELGYADHHSLLAGLFLWAVALLLPDSPSRNQLRLSGVLFGLMVWVSPEALMPMGLVYISFGLLWLGGNTRAMHELLSLASFAAITTTLAVMIERPAAAWFTPIYDSVSVVHAYLLALTAIAVCLLARVSTTTLRLRLWLGAALGACLLGALWLVYPLALKGPMAEVDPYILSDFLPNISEAKSIFDQKLFFTLTLLCHPLLAIALCFIAYRRGDCILRPSAALKLGYLCITLGMLFSAQVRWCYYYYPVVALAIAPWIASLFTPEDTKWRSMWPARWLIGMPPHKQMLRRLPIITLTYLAPFILALGVIDNAPARKKSFEACSKQVRIAIADGSLQTALGSETKTLFAHTNWGGNLLFFTPYKIVASNYHREGKGIKYVWEAEKIAELKTLRHHFAERKIDALLQCPVWQDHDLILQNIYSGSIKPNWLKPIPLATTGDPADAPKLFKVLP